MGSSFPFGKLRCRFFKPERKGTSRTGNWVLINRIVKNQEDKSKREVHHRLSTFLVWEVLLTVIRTGRQKLPEQAIFLAERNGLLLCMRVIMN